MINFPIDVDLLITGGKILTGTIENPVVDTVAVKHGRILALGRGDSINQLEAKRRIDLNNKILVPGFIDAHNHFLLYCMWLRHLDCRLPLNGEIDDLLQKIALQANNTPKGKWIKGWGFADYKIKQRRFPTLIELDEVAPAHPVSIIHVSGHSAVANSKGLEMLGITRQTPDPPGGKIDHDPLTGEPNGILHENALQDLSISGVVDEFVGLDSDKQMAAITVGAEEYAKVGITTACDAGCKPELFSIYQTALKTGVLKSRIVAMPSYDWSEPILASGLISGFGSERLKLGPVKLLGDGSLSGRTAAVSVPYENTNNTGILLRTQEALDEIVQQLDRKGFQIAIHAIGDRAVQQVLRSYKKVIGGGVSNVNRHRIEHGGVLSPEIIQAIADMDVVVAAQPRMLFEQGDGFYKSCGRERIHWVYPYRSLIEAGVHVAGSSDNPVVSPDPVLGMRDSIMRKTEEGRVLAPEQRLDPEQALTMFTKEAAYSLIEENNLGTIAEGKQADMVILSEDPLSTPPETWEKQMRVEMTIVGGEIVYTSNQFKAVN